MRIINIPNISKILMQSRLWIPVVIIAIIIWQSQFIIYDKLDSEYSRKDASGLSINQAREFTYLFYYTGFYPLRVSAGPQVFSSEGASKLIKDHPDTLYDNFQNFITWGEHGRSLYMLAAAYLKGSTEDLNVFTINGVLLVSALIMLYVFFELCKKRFLGILLVILYGSNPFILYEVYKSNNIFALAIISMLILLSINLPVIFNTLNRTYTFTTAVVSGLILAYLSHTRAEFTMPVLSCIFVYLTIPKSKLQTKLLVTTTFIITLLVGTYALTLYFNYKLRQVEGLMMRAAPNNRTLNPAQTYHNLWHPIWIGFSDFDKKYQTEWDDNAAYRAILPELIMKDSDKFGIYQSQNTDILSVEPEYNIAMRKRVLSMIMSDPYWYLNIIWNRLIRLFSEAPPIYINFKDFLLEIPFHSLLSVYVIGYLIYRKNWTYIKLILFTIPVSLPIILIYSGKGITNITNFHYMAFSVLMVSTVNKTLELIKGRSLKLQSLPRQLNLKKALLKGLSR